MRTILLVALSVSLGQLSAEPAPQLREALAKQKELKSVFVKFQQDKNSSRPNRTYQHPGQLWLIPGTAFRWEVGNPKLQTVIYEGRSVYFLDEVKKTGIRVDPSDRRAKPLLLTLGIGKEATYDELTKAFEIEATNQVDDHFVARLIPRSGRLKRYLTELLMQVNLTTSFPEKIAWTQKDGTKVSTLFRKPTLNKSLPGSIFSFDVNDYTWEK